MKNKIDFKKQGKKNRASGARFERKVRVDLEQKGWIIDKWSNTVDLELNKLIAAKHKFQGIGRPMVMGTGFPDFVAFKFVCPKIPKHLKVMNDYDKYMVEGIEVKSNGYLSKEEKIKCKWLLSNKIFSKILIASKSKKRGEIDYKDVVSYINNI